MYICAVIELGVNSDIYDNLSLMIYVILVLFMNDYWKEAHFMFYGQIIRYSIYLIN